MSDQKRFHKTLTDSKIKIRAVIRKITMRVNAIERHKHALGLSERTHLQDLKGYRKELKTTLRILEEGGK